jgi:hypothetical protein
MSLKISELPLSGTVSGTELVPIVQDGETRQITLSEIKPVVPSTAQFYLPDISTIGTAITDIVSNYGPTGTATYSDDTAFWGTFTTSNVVNGIGENPSEFYIGGFYNEAQYVAFGDDLLQIVYTGNVNFEPSEVIPSYEAITYNVLASITEGYDILNYVKLSFKGNVGINYEWTDAGSVGTDYELSGNFTDLEGGTILTFSIDIDIPNDVVTWAIGVLP